MLIEEGDALAFVADGESSIDHFVEYHRATNVVTALAPRWQLKLQFLKDDGAVLLHDAVVMGGKPSPSTILPKVRQPWYFRSHSIPMFVGWLNYWARDTVAAIGYSAAEDGGTIFASTREVGDGALVLQLTADPLALARPEHLAALQNAYHRLPVIGGRDTMPT